MTMGWAFWLPIILGALIGLVVSIIANILTPVVSSYWQRRRTARLEDTKKKAFAVYEQISMLKDGRQDKYLWLLHQITRVLLLFTAFLFSTLAGLSFAIMLRIDNVPRGMMRDGPTFVFMAFGTYYLFRAAVAVRRNREWIWRLNNFDKYKSDLVKEFGEPPISESNSH